MAAISAHTLQNIQFQHISFLCLGFAFQVNLCPFDQAVICFQRVPLGGSTSLSLMQGDICGLRTAVSFSLNTDLDAYRSMFFLPCTCDTRGHRKCWSELQLMVSITRMLGVN